MKSRNLASKIILSNIQNYHTADVDVENIYYKALDQGVHSVLIGGASFCVTKKFAARPVKTAVCAAYPSGAVPAELKAFEIIDAEKKYEDVEAFFVTAAMGWFLSGHADDLKKEMEACVTATKKPVWFITELTQMPADKRKEFCEIAEKAGVAGIMTSVLFAPYELPVAGPVEIKELRSMTGLKIAAPTKSGREEEWQALIDAGADFVVVNTDNFPAGD